LGELRVDLPTAMLAVNTAIGSVQALRERALPSPRQGLDCFDDVEHLAVLSPFPHTPILVRDQIKYGPGFGTRGWNSVTQFY
jgi:hypothetical protein